MCLEKGTNNTTNEPKTKAMLDADGFKASGNRLQIYDFVDNGTTPHINDQIGPDVPGSPLAQATAGVWPFVNGPHQWTPGTHRFFGWLALDAGMTENNTPEAFFGTGFSFNQATKTLTIPQKTMSADTPQFDFMYSNIFATEPINEPVDLEFGHLFAAYYFSFTNDSAEPLHLESVSLNIKSTASATINFSDSDPALNLAYGANQPAIEKTYNRDIAAGTTIDVLLTGNTITSTTNIPNSNFRLIWPQDLADATIDVVFTAMVSIPYFEYDTENGEYSVLDAEEVAGGAYKVTNGHYEYVGKGNGTHTVYFKHDSNGEYAEVIPAPTEQEMSKSIPLAAVTSGSKWIGGEKYNYNLSFSNDFIDLKVVVMRWDGGHGGDIAFN